MDSTQIALSASAIGAGGAVAAQIVAQMFTARRDTKRLKWEQERAERQTVLDSKRFSYDVKRVLLVAILKHVFEFDSKMDALEDTAEALSLMPDGSHHPTVVEEVVSKFLAENKDWWDEFSTMYAEVSAMVPGLVPTMVKISRACHEWQDAEGFLGKYARIEMLFTEAERELAAFVQKELDVSNF